MARKLAQRPLTEEHPGRPAASEVAIPPTAQIVVPDRDVTVTTDSVQVVAEAHDEKHRIADIILTINGSVQRGLGGLAGTSDMLKRREWSVRLAPGENRLAAYARSSAGVRSAETLRLVTHHAPASAAGLKPRLWFLGVAVSSYKTPAYDLQYPVSDVRRLLACLNCQKGRLFEDVHAKLLVNESTTREEINDARETFLSRASVRDMIVIFLAGHGVRDRRGGFYFLTHDADAERPHRRGYSWSDIQNQLLQDLAPQKVVLLVDTCHAGGVTKGATTYRGIDPQQEAELELLADRLKEATGCYLFMAAKQDERAAEAKQWGGGAFATALIEALEGRAAKDGAVTILALLDYVDRRVIELTAGAQHPTWSVPRNAGNFPIAAVGR